MMRISVPCSSKCVAKLCRSVWTLTFLSMPAAARAERQAAYMTANAADYAANSPGAKTAASSVRGLSGVELAAQLQNAAMMDLIRPFDCPAGDKA